MRFRATAIAMLCMLLACSMLVACSSSSSANISFGVLTDVPGMSEMNPETGEFTGYEVDVARAVCERIYGTDVQVTFVGVSGETRESMLETGVIDALISCYTITDERAQTYNLSVPYYMEQTKVMVKKDSGITSIADMDGMTVGVLGASTNAQGLLEYASDHSVTIFASGYDTFMQAKDGLLNGIIDGFSADGVVLKGYLDDSCLILPDGFSPQEYGIVTRKDDTELAASIDDAIAAMEQDGTLSDLQEKWGIAS